MPNNAPSLTGLGGDSTVYRKNGGPVRLDTGGNSNLVDADNNGFVVERVGTGFTGGVLDLAPVPDGSGRVFVVEKNGRISILDPATGAKSTFLQIGSISTSGEDGLLGFATAPDYAVSGRFYVYVTNSAGNNEVRSYARSAGNPDAADAASADLVLSIPHPTHNNHNGGWIGFGPDGMLYIATGDGGGGGDPNRNAQNTDSLLGKMLRIDVSADAFPGDPARDYAIPNDNPFAGGGGRGEIWAVGLRNPFRNSFDAATGDLYIGDVGQGAREEIDVIRAGVGGANFGWSILEGTQVYNGGSTAELIAPVLEYSHGSGAREGRSVTGGYVYNGPVESLKGRYFFGDFVTANIFSVPTGKLTQGATVRAADFDLYKIGFTPDSGRINQISSFGVDAAGNLYVLDFSDGEVFRVGASPQANFGAGRFTAAITAGKAAAQDQLLIETAGTGVTLSNGTAAGSEVRVGGVLIGFVASGGSGSGGQDLVVDFTSGATPVRVDVLLRALAYANAAGANAIEGARTVSYALNDGAGAAGGGTDTVIATSSVNVIAAAAPRGGLFDYSDGGDDVAIGGTGDDGFYFGAAFTAADQVDGGAGALDQVGLQGDYSAGLTLGAKSLVNIEQLVLLPGSDARFGDNSGALYSYHLTTVDENVAGGDELIVTFNTLRQGESVTFDGAAETNGSFLTFGGQGMDQITGGQGDDGFFFGIDKRFGEFDAVDGQGGTDQLGLQGVYTGESRILFGDLQLKSIEFIVALTGGDSRFGAGGAGYSYDLTTSDGNVEAGKTLIVSANTLRSDEVLLFDGSAESDGRFRIFSGNGSDLIAGGAGDDEIVGLGGDDTIDGGGGGDTIRGGLGADALTGGEGADIFAYGGAADSTGLDFDTLIGFDYRVDRIDLPGAVTGFTGKIETGALNGVSFDADIAAAVDGALQANSAVIFRPDAGDYAGRDFAIVDANGDGVYTAGQDFLFEVVDPAIPIDPVSDFFI
jgi:glucose/arabinose dehydrogenase